jgi:16S rRNA C967 or C1407 C5-methylase (RsmB/RsmF family)
MTGFPEQFKTLLTESVGEADAARVLEALEAPPSVSIRLNPFKLRECPFPDAVPVPWSPWGYLLKERPVFTLDPLFHAGAYYVQDTSAMFVGHLFRQLAAPLQEGLCVLDLCAAPGGKTTDLAASLREHDGGKSVLLSNEVIRSRYAVLRTNVATWGDPRVGTVSRDPSAFGNTPLFDIVVADVPCSGEGMFRKDAKAVEDWSPETVEFCVSRSRRILSDIWPTLKEGGLLLFSTCTFNRRENDETVAWAAERLEADILDLGPQEPAVRTEHGYLMLPGRVPGEGQYAAALRKKGSLSPLRKADPFTLFRAERPVEPEDSLPRWDVDRETALRYLHGDALRLAPEAPLGPICIGFQGFPLGPAKNLGTRCNNLYPKAKRIKMDIR